MVIRPSAEAFARHQRNNKHNLENPLRDVILGGQDGLVNSLGIILGVAAVTSDIRILIATVLAAACAESISMGAVAYTSALTEKEHYEREMKQEIKEIEKEPEMEKEEIRQIFEKKGFKGKILEEIVETTSKDKSLWLNTMMSEELGLQSINTKEILKSSVIVTIATVVGHLIPLSPFFFATHLTGLILAITISGLALFTTGVYQAITLVGSWWKSGLRMLIIGLGAAGVGFVIAKIFTR